MDCMVPGILQARNWSSQPFPSPGDLPNLRIESRSPALQVDSLPAELQGSLTLLKSLMNSNFFIGIYLLYKHCVSFFCITGEGNGNPLQYSCLENPMDGGAW